MRRLNHSRMRMQSSRQRSKRWKKLRLCWSKVRSMLLGWNHFSFSFFYFFIFSFTICLEKLRDLKTLMTELENISERNEELMLLVNAERKRHGEAPMNCNKLNYSCSSVLTDDGELQTVTEWESKASARARMCESVWMWIKRGLKDNLFAFL